MFKCAVQRLVSSSNIVVASTSTSSTLCHFFFSVIVFIVLIVHFEWLYHLISSIRNLHQHLLWKMLNFYLFIYLSISLFSGLLYICLFATMWSKQTPRHHLSTLFQSTVLWINQLNQTNATKFKVSSIFINK